jgi:trimethylamine---corrinoid protein Co-methyltransferase
LNEMPELTFTHPWRLGLALPVDCAELEKIEEAADKLLAEVGLCFEGDPETLEIWRQHGMHINGDRVLLDGAWLRETIRNSAPKSFRLRSRNPDRDTIVGAEAAPVLAPVYGPPNVQFADGSRHFGSLDLYRELVSMAHASPAISNTGHMICVLNDVPEAERPMQMALAHLHYSDKPFMGCVSSPEAAEAVIDLVADAIRRPAANGDCDLLHLINATPPLTYKETPLKSLRAISRRRQAVMVTSYMMMGATSPATIAGSLIQGYAETLAGLALSQLWGPGTPVVFGLFAIPFSMRSMLPVFGDPVSQLVQIYSVQLARRLGVPARGDGGVTSANVDDAQAGYESARSMSSAILAGADFILHSVGWLEQGRCVSIAKFEREAAAIAQTYIGETSPVPPPLPLAGTARDFLKRSQQ